LALNYAYRPGSLITLGANQGFSTNIDGQRLTAKTYFINLIEPLTDKLKLTLGTRYFLFNDPSFDLPSDISRFEGSASINYNITQNTSFNLGYNYSKQDGDASFAEDVLGFSEPDFVVNRFFIGINTGFVGLPL
jgi:opacity protein-like surface antigen